MSKRKDSAPGRCHTRAANFYENCFYQTSTLNGRVCNQMAASDALQTTPRREDESVKIDIYNNSIIKDEKIIGHTRTAQTHTDPTASLCCRQKFQGGTKKHATLLHPRTNRKCRKAQKARENVCRRPRYHHCQSLSVRARYRRHTKTRHLSGLLLLLAAAAAAHARLRRAALIVFGLVGLAHARMASATFIVRNQEKNV